MRGSAAVAGDVKALVPHPVEGRGVQAQAGGDGLEADVDSRGGMALGGLASGHGPGSRIGGGGVKLPDLGTASSS